jgi:hypothetical protein
LCATQIEARAVIGRQSDLHVLRARVHGAGSDPFRARLSVERMLASVDAGQVIGPAAILVARRARLDLTQSRRARQPPVAAMLVSLVSRSCRPIHGFVPADAEAVLFADDVELLVCLARASVAGGLAGQWWWDSLLAARYGPDAVLAAWLGRPTAIAPALDALEREGKAVTFVTRLGEGAAGRLQQALADIYDLCLPNQEAAEPTGGAPPFAQFDVPERHALLPPWDSLGLDARTLALPPSLQTVIGLAASLCRAPAHARSPEFQRTLLVWQAARLERTTAVAPPGEPWSPSAAIRTEPDTPADSFASHAVGTIQPDPANPTMDPRPTVDHHAPLCGETGTPQPTGEVAPAQALEGRQVDRISPQDGIGAGSDAPQHPAIVSPDAAVVVETRFGGLLFLLNVALALELWGDFTAPRHQGEAMTPWEWLAAMGERLCGARLRDDPIWDLLRQLSGIEQTAFPSSGQDDEEWRIPPQWLHPFGPLPQLRAFFTGRRLRIEHPAGFPLIDQPFGKPATPDENAANLRALLGGTDALDGGPIETVVRRAHAAPGRKPRARSDAMARYLRVRLCLALHARRFREAGRIVLHHDARLTLTGSRLDAIFALSRHPVAIRVAGLDRDPGWIAAAGRDIRLYFQ